MVELPEPVEGKDFFIDEVRRYTVMIEVTVSGRKEEDETDICLRAVEGFQKGEIDGESDVVTSEKVNYHPTS